MTIAATVASIALAIWAKTSVEIGATLTLVTLLLTLGLTAFVALRLQLDEMDSRRVAGLPLQRLPMVPEIEPAITGLVRDVADIKQSHGGLMTQIATARIRQAAEEVESLADGVFTCSSDDELSYIRQALADTRHQVRAIAARGAEWWDSADASAYWHAYEEVAHRVKITRIFIVAAERDEATLSRVIARHARSGMRALVISASRIPARHVKPVVIFDDRLVHRAGTAIDRETQVFTVQFSSRPADVVAAEETFHVVSDLASEASGQQAC